MNFTGFNEWVSFTLIQNSKKLNYVWAIAGISGIGGTGTLFAGTSGAILSNITKSALLIILALAPAVLRPTAVAS